MASGDSSTCSKCPIGKWSRNEKCRSWSAASLIQTFPKQLRNFRVLMLAFLQSPVVLVYSVHTWTRRHPSESTSHLHTPFVSGHFGAGSPLSQHKNSAGMFSLTYMLLLLRTKLSITAAKQSVAEWLCKCSFHTGVVYSVQIYTTSLVSLKSLRRMLC